MTTPDAGRIRALPSVGTPERDAGQPDSGAVDHVDVTAIEGELCRRVPPNAEATWAGTQVWQTRGSRRQVRGPSILRYSRS